MDNKGYDIGISRIWHGWTSKEKAYKYEKLLKEEIFIEIANKNIVGYRGIQLLRRNLESEVEFITIMTFDSLDSLKTFAGEYFEKAYVPEPARMILKRWDGESQHYEIKAMMSY